MRFPHEYNQAIAIKTEPPSNEEMDSPGTIGSLQMSSTFDHDQSEAYGTEQISNEAKGKKIFKWIFLSLLFALAALLIKLYLFPSSPIKGQQKNQPNTNPNAEQEVYSDQYENWMGEPNFPVEKPRKLNKQQQAIKKECYKINQLRHNVFFLAQDKQSMTKEQVDRFEFMNRVCHFVVIPESSLTYYIKLWNQRQEHVRFDQLFINQSTLSKEDKRVLLIWIQLYYWPGIYLHPSLGVNFGKYISDRYLFDANCGTEMLFAKHDHQNQKGILVPERDFKTVKVCQRFSRWIRDMIKKIIAKEDWMSICEKQQCAILKNANTYPDKN